MRNLINTLMSEQTNRTVNGKIRNNMTNHRSIKRETGMGVEAQLDWKENMHYTLSTGVVIELNIFALVYSYSRYRINFISLTKKQGALFHYLDQAFEAAGGVPDILKTDNMKTVMDEARTDLIKSELDINITFFLLGLGT